MPIPKKAVRAHRRGARQLAYDYLLDWIRDGTLAPGEQIQDLEISESLGISRTPVREALHMLMQQGLVELVPGRQTRVTPLEPTAWRHIYEPMVALEAIAARHAAERATPDDVQRLRDLHARFVSTVKFGDAGKAREVDAEFHRFVVSLSDSPYLDMLISTLKIHRDRMNSVYFDQVGPQPGSIQEHAAVVEAIAAGDPARAAEAVRTNWRSSARRVEAAVEAMPAAPETVQR